MTWRTHMKYSTHGWFFKANSKSCHVKWKFLVSLKTEFCNVIFCCKLGMWCFAQVSLWESMCCFAVTPHVLRTSVCRLWGEDTSTVRHRFLDRHRCADLHVMLRHLTSQKEVPKSFSRQSNKVFRLSLTLCGCFMLASRLDCWYPDVW